MPSLELQRKDIQLVINFPINNSLKEMELGLSSNGYTYAYIIHDKDTHENGDLKTKHIHLVISSLKRHQLKYYLYQVAELLDINENQISILPSDSLAFSIQYLIHKNDKEKYQYNVTSIRTNLSEGNLFDYLNEDTFRKLTTEDIVRLCVESGGNRVRIIETLGIARYTLYRNTITDILNTLGYYNKI